MNTSEFGDQMHLAGQIEALLKLQTEIEKEINKLEALKKDGKDSCQYKRYNKEVI